MTTIRLYIPTSPVGTRIVVDSYGEFENGDTYEVDDGSDDILTFGDPEAELPPPVVPEDTDAAFDDVEKEEDY